MLPQRKVLLGVCLVLVVGSISATVGYALHLRSDSYRHSVARELGLHLGMDVSIGRVRPLSLGSRAFDQVRVSLDQGGSEVFVCNEAIWRAADGGEGPFHVLELIDGWLLVGSGTWTEAEYRRMLAGGLGHDFLQLGLREAHLKRIDLRFMNPPLEFRAGSTTGIVIFDESGTGQASLNCFSLNGVKVDEPINIAMRFVPGEQLDLQMVRLTLPPIPVSSLGIDKLLAHPITQGEFEGRVTYRETPDGRAFSATGSLLGAQLAEFTAGLGIAPLEGTIFIDLDDATIVDRQLRALSFHGRISDLRIGQILPRFTGAQADARLTVRVSQLRWADQKLAHLSAQAVCERISLGELSQRWGKGMITGQAKLDVGSLLIVDDRLQFAEVEIMAEPPGDGPGLIDRDLIAQAVQRWLGIDLSASLPEQIEYTKLGVRLILDDGELRVLGTHGPDRKSILTVKLFGRSWSAITQPDESYEVPDLVGLFRESAEEVDMEEVHSWWQWLRSEGQESQ